MKKMSLITLVGSVALVTQVHATPVTYDAFDGFTRGAGNNDSDATWQYLAAKYGWQNSQASHLPDYSYRDFSTATKINNNQNVGLSIPRGERPMWHSKYTYAGSVKYDTGLEWTNHSNLDPDADGDGTTELVEHIHMAPGFTGNIPSSYVIADTLLAFDPHIDEATTFSFNFDVASDYHVSGSADCSVNGCPGEGQRLGLFLNDAILSPDLFWQEDNDAGNGSKIDSGGNYDDWVLLPSRFARFDNPISMSFDLLMNPGDTFYLRLNNNGSTLWDGLVLTEAVAAAGSTQQVSGSASGNLNTVPAPAPLLLLLAGVPLLFQNRKQGRRLPSLPA